MITVTIKAQFETLVFSRTTDRYLGFRAKKDGNISFFSSSTYKDWSSLTSYQTGDEIEIIGEIKARKVWIPILDKNKSRDFLDYTIIPYMINYLVINKIVRSF